MRREFSRKTKAQAFERSAGRCEAIWDGERCGLKLQVGHITYDHVLADWLGGEPTLENCQVICDACDARKTPGDQSRIAKAKRQRDAHTGAKKARQPFRGWRRFNGDPVWRDK